MCNEHNTLTAMLVISVQSDGGRGCVGGGCGYFSLALCDTHNSWLYWLSVYKVIVGVGMVGECVGTLHLLCVMHVTAGYTGYQCTELLWVWLGAEGGGSVLHLLSEMHVIARLVINVQGDKVRVHFRPSIGQDEFPSACLCSVVYKVIVCACVFQTQYWPRWVPLCLCSVVYKVIVCVCVCVSDPVLAKMGSPLHVFVQ